jgi:Ca2+-transporting ATPase
VASHGAEGTAGTESEGRQCRQEPMTAAADASHGADTDWHARSTAEITAALETDIEAGLSADEVERRLAADGPNQIRDREAISPLAIFLDQFQDVLIYILVFAALLSFTVGLLPGEEPNYVDAGLILLILLGNGLFGFVQDYRAEKSMEALRELSSPDATVIRGGEKRNIDATELVPGDLLVIEQGDAIPADARLLTATNLETQEAPLTGESAAVGKEATPVDPATPIAERRDMVYMNTNAVRGRGKAIVVETGMATEVGSIATQIQEAEQEATPFQAEVDDLGRRIGAGIGLLIGLVVLVQFLFTDARAIAIVLTAVTLAVAAVPEGLPAVVTLTLALGSQKMVERNALVRRLSVVESLGSVDVILTDKTGTLTESQMTVSRVAAGGRVYAVTGSGLNGDGEFRRDDESVEPTGDDALAAVLRCGIACNNAEKAPEGEDEAYVGDPTEVALLLAARKAGVESAGDRVHEVPFSSDRKRMSVVMEKDGQHTAYTKGATETILEGCDRVLLDGDIEELTDVHRQAIRDRNDDFASDALRVLAFARSGDVDPDADADELERGMVLLGLQGMIDPPRSEVDRAVTDCRNAGIGVVMVTGDNLETAKAVGAQIGFDPAGAMTGPDVDDLGDEALAEAVEDVEIFARMSPAQKVRVLDSLQANGHRVAMTGDGVNDAPGVRNAEVGIAMGQRGTDVTQAASDMVLQDDNFVTIRNAIAEGRGIFDNIRKFVNLLLSANTGEVLTVFLGVLIGGVLFPNLFAAQSEALILTPVMLLWINLVTDGLPALALGVDPKAPDVLEREPRSSETGVIDRRVLASILAIGVTMTAVGLVIFFEGLVTFESLVVAQTLLFTFFVVAEMGVIQVIRRRFGSGVLSNPWLVAAVVASLLLQLVVLYSPLAGLFDVYAPGVPGLGRIGAGVLLVLIGTVALASGIDRLT